MKIISKFNDYYDGVGSSHDAASGLYSRKTKELPAELTTRCSGVYGVNYEFTYRTKLIGFCGKLYPFIHYRWYDRKKNEGGEEFFYTFEEFEAEREFTNTIRSNNAYRYQYFADAFMGWNKENYAKMWFDCDFASFTEEKWGNKRKKYLNPKDVFLEHKVPYFFIGSPACNINDRPRNDPKAQLILNPCLSDYKFYRIFDAYSAYQEISCYLSNDLAKPDDPYIEPVSDKLKAQAHGYDQFSFKKPKGDKKKKRCKR